jgi:carbon-monoxide dehydrogenase medium subunit
VPLAGFWTGFMTTILAADELVTSMVVPVDAGRTAFVKFGRRAANTPAIVMVAAHATFEGDTVTGARIALGAAGPHPLRLSRAEAAITGTGLDEDAITEAATLAAEDADPENDAIASAWYRRRMVGVFVRRALLKLAEPAGRGA